MKRKMVLGFIVVCSLVLNAAFVTMWLTHAVPRLMMSQRMCSHKNMNCRKCPLHEKLGLTDSQWGVLKPRVEAYRQAVDSVRHEIVMSREALLAELVKTPADTAALRVCRERIQDWQRKMQEQVVANVLEQKAVLTPEQQRQFIAMVRNGMGSEDGSCMAGIMGNAYPKSGR
jgi:Spy/CpxP family protein refolding chaperone